MDPIRLEVSGALVFDDPAGWAAENIDVEHLGGPDREHLPGVRLADSAGTWLIRSEAVKDSFWGERTARLICEREDAQQPLAEPRMAGRIEVDSGQGGVADSREAQGFDYELIMELTSADPPAARRIPGHQAVVCSSGVGDGGYPVIVWRDASGRPARVLVDFWGEDDEDLEAEAPESEGPALDPTLLDQEPWKPDLGPYYRESVLVAWDMAAIEAGLPRDIREEAQLLLVVDSSQMISRESVEDRVRGALERLGAGQLGEDMATLVCYHLEGGIEREQRARQVEEELQQMLLEDWTREPGPPTD